MNWSEELILVGVGIQAIGCIGQIVSIFRKNLLPELLFFVITWAGIVLTALVTLLD